MAPPRRGLRCRLRPDAVAEAVDEQTPPCAGPGRRRRRPPGGRAAWRPAAVRRPRRPPAPCRPPPRRRAAAGARGPIALRDRPAGLRRPCRRNAAPPPRPRFFMAKSTRPSIHAESASSGAELRREGGGRPDAGLDLLTNDRLDQVRALREMAVHGRRRPRRPSRRSPGPARPRPRSRRPPWRRGAEHPGCVARRRGRAAPVPPSVLRSIQRTRSSNGSSSTPDSRC